ncbi:uncharacterized protein ACNLHF_018910 [Anomaloglossus baeobatrachus]
MTWTQICRDLFPLWDEVDTTLQVQIDKDVRNRWRSVKDRFTKDLTKVSKSGSAGQKGKILYEDELQFLLTGRSLRQTEGNLLPVEHDDSTSEMPEGSTEVEETAFSEDADTSSASAAKRPCIPNSAAGTGTDPGVFTFTSTASAADPPQSSSSAASARNLTLRRKKAKGVPLSKNVAEQCDELTCEALSLLKNSASKPNSKCDLFAASLGSRLSDMSKETQSACMMACCALFDGFEKPPPHPRVGDLLNLILDAFSPTQINRPVRNLPPQPNLAYSYNMHPQTQIAGAVGTNYESHSQAAAPSTQADSFGYVTQDLYRL